MTDEPYTIRHVRGLLSTGRSVLSWSLINLDISLELRLFRKKHHVPYDSIDASQVNLPASFSVCTVGASSGIGAGIARSLARAHAAAIAFSASSEESLSKSTIKSEVLAINRKVKVIGSSCDVQDEKSVAVFASEVANQFGRLDLLVYNAGFYASSWEAKDEALPEDLSKAFGINIAGLNLAVRAFLPLLKSSKEGRRSILAIGAYVMLFPRGPDTPVAYSITKLALARYIEYLAARESDIFRATVHPGAVQTKMALKALTYIYDC